MFIYAVIFEDNSDKNSKKPEIVKIYFWNEIHDKSENSIIGLLSSFEKSLNYYYFDFEILPPPTSSDYIYEPTLLKLYGKDLFHITIDYNFNEFHDYYYKYSLSLFKNGDIYNFVLMINQSASILVKLEKHNKNRKLTEKFLSETNLLVATVTPIKNPIEYDDFLSCLSYNLQHCGTYINPHDLYNTSFFFSWISEIWNFLKNSCPQIYNILAFPYMLCSSYFTIYSQETLILIFLLLNFATYPKDYTYRELFYFQDNPFTLLLDTPDYYKWWNVKALINFKWNTYGRLYYFIIWAIYSIYMSCFLIVSTIPEHKISWNNQAILLVSTIFFGIFHFIFEIRQFIHRPIVYVASPWNWFEDIFDSPIC
ncbi:hypothetical protein C2G38_915445 [Gigaspora rosea]|uniref:Uncharacterized protein n=1 Tax=Gigaspora rosea TaxID=44941 RepID=A0A397VKK8_9GLOM|nr:hypothetical protein C2G38_915445 [Gigaspora rosea]